MLFALHDRRRHHGPVRHPRTRRLRAMDAGRDDDGRQHVRQRAQGTRRRAVQRVVPTARHHHGVSARLGRRPGRVHLGQLVAGRPRRPELGPAARTTRATRSFRALGGSRSRSTGCTRVFDTGEHHIGGVQQQQGGGYGSVSFTSQFGTFEVSSLHELGTPAGGRDPPAAAPGPAHQSQYQSARRTSARTGTRRRRRAGLPRVHPAIPKPSSRPSNRWPGCISAASSPTRNSPRRRPNCSAGSDTSLQRRRADHHDRLGSRTVVAQQGDHPAVGGAGGVDARRFRPATAAGRYRSRRPPRAVRSRRGNISRHASSSVQLSRGRVPPARRVRGPRRARSGRPGCAAATSDVHLPRARRRDRGPARECRFPTSSRLQRRGRQAPSASARSHHLEPVDAYRRASSSTTWPSRIS